jgi:transcription termination factor Rho
MSVLDRDALEASPLADLHAIASEIGLDGYRRLRKDDLIDAILEAGGGAEEKPKRRRTRRKADEEPAAVAAPAEIEVELEAEAEAEEEAEEEEEDDEDRAPRRARRGRRGGRGRSREAAQEAENGEATFEDAAAPAAVGERPEREERTVEGTIELLGNGSAFVRVTPPEPSEEDVYVSAAQVRRCELVSGDIVTGPVRAPRRSERYPSLVRVETINGAPADEVSEGTRYEDLPVAWPSERFELAGDDPTVKAIDDLAPFGKGSRVLVTGPSRAGKTEALLRLAQALRAQDGIELRVALAGARPEEPAAWREAGVEVEAAATLDRPADAQASAEQAVEQAKRVAARGGDAIVIVDTLDALPPAAQRKVLAAGRNLEGGGSLTVIAAAERPLGGETTVVALDPDLAGAGRFPALDLRGSGTIRADALVGEAGVEAIRGARAEALGR